MSSSTSSVNKKKNLPIKALNIFDALINQLIDGAEQQSLQISSQQCAQYATPTTSCSNTLTASHGFDRNDSSMTLEPKHCTRQGAGRDAFMSSESGTTLTSSRGFGGRDSLMPSESSMRSQRQRQGAGREASMTSESGTLTYGYDSSATTDPLASRKGKNDGRETTSCSDTLTPMGSESSMIPRRRRQGAGRETSMTGTLTRGYIAKSMTSESNILQSSRHETTGRETSTASSQRVKLTTKRLANGIDGCEVTVATQNEDGNPLVIRAVCPNFEPRRIWVNGKPFDYIDGESDNPIFDSSVPTEYDRHHQLRDISEEEEDGTSFDYDGSNFSD